jgi:hypothetical protein
MNCSTRLGFGRALIGLFANRQELLFMETVHSNGFGSPESATSSTSPNVCGLMALTLKTH